MVFTSPSDPILAAAFWAGVASMLLTLMLGLQIIIMRARLRLLERINAAAVAKWRPVLHAAVVGDGAPVLPALTARERFPFLRLWVYLHESLRGEAGLALNDVARQLACGDMARSLLARGNRTERLLAVRVLGLLRDAASWQELQSLAMTADSVMSIYAFWSLVRIDPAKALEHLMEQVMRRQDWPVTRVILILQEAADACPATLEQAMDVADEPELLRLLQIANALRSPMASERVSRLLSHPSTEVLIAALKLVQSPQVLPLVVELLSAADWRVRMQAAKALGRIGGPAQVPALVAALGDVQWWVRYRAAQALISLPFLGRGDLEQLRATLTDRFAGDILTHALCEKGLS